MKLYIIYIVNSIYAFILQHSPWSRVHWDTWGRTVQSSSAHLQITKDTAIAEETKAVVQKEENQAAEKAMETQAIADDAQRDLNEALPALVGPRL